MTKGKEVGFANQNIYKIKIMAMEVEQNQGDVVQQFVSLAATARGRAAVELITHATSHPQLFAFSELLSAPHIAEVVILPFFLAFSRLLTEVFVIVVCLFEFFVVVILACLMCASTME